MPSLYAYRRVVLTIHVRPYGPADVEHLPSTAIRSQVAGAFPSRRKPKWAVDEEPLTTQAGRTFVEVGDLARELLRFQRKKRPTEPWALVIVAHQLTNESSIYGITYDSSPDPLFQRRGCAVLWSPIARDEWPPRRPGEDEQAFFAWNMVHELGHVLNLDHADADAATVMASPPPFNRPDLEYSELSEEHLAQHDQDSVLPGRKVYGDLACHAEHPAREAVGERVESKGLLKLDLQTFHGTSGYAGKNGSLTLGEPLALRTIVRNRRSRRVTGLARNGTGVPAVRLEVLEPGGRWKLLAPRFGSCGAAPTEMAPRETVTQDHLVFGALRYPFSIPGTYSLRAVLELKRGVVVSKARKLVVAPPTSRRKREQLGDLQALRAPVALEQGLGALTEAEHDGLQKLSGSLASTSLSGQWARLAFGRTDARAVLDGSRSRSLRRRALERLEKVGRTRSAPPTLRQQAWLWAARVRASTEDWDAAKRLLDKITELEDGDDALVQRAARERARQGLA